MLWQRQMMASKYLLLVSETLVIIVSTLEQYYVDCPVSGKEEYSPHICFVLMSTNLARC